MQAPCTRPHLYTICICGVCRGKMPKIQGANCGWGMVQKKLHICREEHNAVVVVETFSTVYAHNAVAVVETVNAVERV